MISSVPPGVGETARHHLVAAVPTARRDQPAGTVIAGLSGRTFDETDMVYVVDDDRRLVGAAPLRAVLAGPPDRAIATLMLPDSPAAQEDWDQERVANLACRHGLASVPVVDRQHRLLGAVPAAALLQVLRREHVEDMHRLAGIVHQVNHARHAMEESAVRRVRARLPWLLVGFIGSMIATATVARFEAALEAEIAIAFFLPAIVYLADAIGTQTEAVVVRGLTLSHVPLGELLWREVGAGAVIGGILGALAFPAALAGFGSLRLATAVALAILVAGTIATTIGLLLPWLLSRFGRDPAFGSGPLATVIQDVLSIVVYFVIAGFIVVGFGP